MIISPLVYELLNINYIWYGIYLWVYFIKRPFKQLDFLSQNNYRQKKILRIWMELKVDIPHFPG